MPEQTSSGPGKDAGQSFRWRRRAASVLLGTLLGLGVLSLASDVLSTAQPPAPPQAAGDIMDPGDLVVAEGRFEAFLVQAGTQRPYEGNGPPGISLQVQASGDVLGWTLEGWANETAPPSTPLRPCSSPSVHFDQYDWFYEADGATGRGGGVFQTTLTTVPQRLGPSGDQCHARIDATGIWMVTIRVEGKPIGEHDRPGPARGIYDAPDGRHVDLWDLTLSRPFQVPG